MDATTSHILVPVDYSDKAVFGLQMASNLVKKYGGKITVLNVLKGVDPIWSDFFTDEERTVLLGKYRNRLDQFTRSYIPGNGYELNCIIEKGKLCDTILETAENVGATLIVMGTSTVDNIKKWVIGTNALRVVTEAKCPVITLKKSPEKAEIKNIVLPLDITKETREKTVEAVHLAKMYNAKIHVVSAYTVEIESNVRKLELQMEQVIKFIQNHQVECSSEILKVNDRVDGVLKYIEDKNADLIVITTHQQLEIVNSFMGSFAKSIIRGAKVPVMSMVPKINHYLVFAMPGTGE